MVSLVEGSSTNTQLGKVSHDVVVGLESGSRLELQSGKALSLLFPTLADFVFQMPRGAQVIYPKDLGAILLAADISSGHKVLESGVGSGALSMALLRCGAEVVGVEVREDYANLAKKNVRSFLGSYPYKYDVVLGDIFEGAPSEIFDRVVFDLGEPWRALPSARKALSNSGVLCCYVTNVTQASELVNALPAAGFASVDVVEILERHWYFKGVVARPHHRMVGHTGFIVTARPKGPRISVQDLLPD